MWNIEVERNNVIFAAGHGWGYNKHMSEKTGILYEQIDETLKDSTYTDLHEKIPVPDAVFVSIIENSPVASQSLEYRLPIIIKKDIDTDMTQTMINQDPDGPLRVMFFGVKNSEMVSDDIYCRVFSGTLRKGDEIHVGDCDEKVTVTHTFIYNGPYHLSCREIPAGKMGCVFTDREVCFGEIYIHY